MNLIPAIGVTADALSAERTRLEVIGENIANANTTRGPDGKPYQRKVVSFATQMEQTHDSAPGSLAAVDGVKVASITNDPTPGPMVYDPGNPAADKNGMVRMPNVNLAYEMVDLITASRAYQANLSVIRTSRQMALQALEIGK